MLDEFQSIPDFLDQLTYNYLSGTYSEARLMVPADWAEFARLCRIRSGNKIVPFNPFDYQIRLNEIVDNHYGTVVLKARQTGITEQIANKFLHKAIRNPAYTAAVLSLGGDESMNIARRIRRMAMSIPGFRFASDSLTNLEIEGGGRILFRPATPNSIRSLESISDLLFDEAAFVPLIEEMYGGAVPATEMVGDEARIIIVSTPSDDVKITWYWEMLQGGLDTDLEEVCAKIRAGELEPFQYFQSDDGWAKVIIHWKAHPVYGQNPKYLEKIKTQKKLTDRLLQREYNLGISSASGGLFPAEFVDRGARGEYKENPSPLHQYLAGIDPSFGGSDYFVCQIWDITAKPYSLVAQYREKSLTKQRYLDGALQLIDKFEPTIISVEGNSGGALYLEDLIMQRPNYRFERVNTTAQSKIVNTDRIILALERDEMIYPPRCPLATEMKHFSQVGTQRMGVGGANDDTVMAAAIAWAWVDDAVEAGYISDEEFALTRNYPS